MEDCCKRFALRVRPREYAVGLFSEIHECHVCGRKIMVTFRGVGGLGGGEIAESVGAEYWE